MSAGDLAVVLLAVAALALTAVTTALLLTVRRATHELTRALDRLEQTSAEVRASAAEASTAADAAGAEVARIEHLLDTSEGVVDRVDAATELAHQAFSRPVIRAMAVGAGTRQAVRRLRGRDDDRPEPPPAAEVPR